jgi:hypothetical protein
MIKLPAHGQQKEDSKPWIEQHNMAGNIMVDGAKRNARDENGKRTTLGIPTWSPTVVLAEPDDA